MANFQGSKINPKRFSAGQIKFHVVALPLSIIMIIPIIIIFSRAFMPLGELFAFPPRIFVNESDIG